MSHALCTRSGWWRSGFHNRRLFPSSPALCEGFVDKDLEIRTRRLLQGHTNQEPAVETKWPDPLDPFRVNEQNTQNGVAYKQQKYISYSSGSWEVQTKPGQTSMSGGSLLIECLNKAPRSPKGLSFVLSQFQYVN